MNALLLAALALQSAGPQTLHGRAVHIFDSASACPLAGVGSRGEHGCNRIALDDDATTAEVDSAAHRIVLRNSKSYASKQIIADVLISGWATSASGAREPVAVHLFVRKKGKTFDAKPHSHAASRERPLSIELEDFTVVLDDGSRTVSALTPESARQAITDPSLAAKLAGELVEVRDNLAPGAAAPGPAPIADVTVAVGLGPAAKDVVRAQLFASGERPKSLADLLRSGAWELKLTALSSLVPKDVVKRDLFLFGVESFPAVAPVKERGLKKGEVIVLGAQGGKGILRLGEASSEVPHAVDAARAFLEQSFLGELLARKAEQALRR